MFKKYDKVVIANNDKKDFIEGCGFIDNVHTTGDVTGFRFRGKNTVGCIGEITNILHFQAIGEEGRGNWYQVKIRIRAGTYTYLNYHEDELELESERPTVSVFPETPSDLITWLETKNV